MVLLGGVYMRVSMKMENTVTVRLKLPDCRLQYFVHSVGRRESFPRNIDIFVNCNWVNTRWQCYSTHNQYIEQHNNNRTTQITAQHNNNRKTIAQHNDNYFWRVRTVPRLVSLTVAFALQLRKKHGKTSVRVVKECCYPLPKHPHNYNTHHTHTHNIYKKSHTSIQYKTHTYTHPYITKLYKTTTVQF